MPCQPPAVGLQAISNFQGQKQATVCVPLAISWRPIGMTWTRSQLPNLREVSLRRQALPALGGPCHLRSYGKKLGTRLESARRKKTEGRWVSKDKDELIADLAAFAPGSASASMPPDLMTQSERDAKRKQTDLTQVRKKVRETPGLSEKKQIGGKWVPKDRDELIVDLAAFASGSANAPMPPVPMTKSERDAKRRHTHEYKTKEAARRQTDEYKTKEAARRQTDEYKAKEKARHAGLVYRERAAATMNIWRAHKRQLKFWESCFTRWQESVCDILNDMVEGSNHIFMYEPQKLTELVRDDLWQCALGKMTRLCAQPYAPCFGSDGSILLVQHGMPHILPSLKRPRGLFGAALVESLREYKLALLLRCRLGPCLDEPGQCDPSSGYLGFAEHHWFAKKFGYRCPMQGVSKGAIPKPTASIRRFLCNNQCPLRCCTSRCPWHRNAGKWNRVGSSECCPCGDDSCNTCVPQDSSRDASLQDPPPPGYKLYTGVGEPISDSSSSQKEVFQLVCEHYKFVPVLIGASYAGFYNRIDRSSGFQLYPHNWDTEQYEQVDCEVDSVSVIGSDQTWTREQRDAWLREPFYHEWKWRPFHGVRLMAASESNYGSSISLDFCLSANARNPLYESALDYLLSASLMNRVEVRKEQRGLGVRCPRRADIYNLRLLQE